MKRRTATLLAIGWATILIIQVGWALVIAYGGLILVATAPFALCTFVSMLQQIRMRQTTLGFACVAIASLPMILSTYYSIIYLPEGHGYYIYALLMLICMSTIIVDVLTRWQSRRARLSVG